MLYELATVLRSVIMEEETDGSCQCTVLYFDIASESNKKGNTRKHGRIRM
ncbi:unnamed protein product [Rhodiola kirilowii]